ncbi:30S ribosomal protein S6e [Candidatus Woesearchaeota archaeon]|nr:30S ribosomal protein S6e [Candidatus Woesearchaeota archaeon]
MAEFKLVISDPKTGKSYQLEAKDETAKHFLGKKIGDKVRGELIDLSGYEFEIRGGSDNCGFPMRKDVEGSVRKRIYAVSGVGIHKKVNFTKKGERKIRRKKQGVKQKKTVCGNTIHAKVSQINLMILKHGSKPLGKEEPKEGASEAKQAESTN